MECYSKKGGESCPQLELRLGLPGDGDWNITNKSNSSRKNSMEREEKDESLLSLGYFSPMHNQQHQKPTEAPPLLQNAEKKASSTPPAAKAAVPNSSQKRSAPGPVVGWPPIRSYRKNLASSSSSKQPIDSESKGVGEKPLEQANKGLFVKINMDGIPIGRKVDLTTYDSYDKLSVAVDELFRGLLAAQRDSSAGGIVNKQEKEKPITGLLDGNGEYTLVYEDNEGDRILVGDVPWHMFVSTVKRLRVLKSSELPGLSLGNGKQGKIPA